jgi:hypothetical protein
MREWDSLPSEKAAYIFLYKNRQGQAPSLKALSP